MLRVVTLSKHISRSPTRSENGKKREIVCCVRSKRCARRLLVRLRECVLRKMRSKQVHTSKFKTLLLP